MSTEFTDRVVKAIHDRAYPGVLNELIDLARYALAQQEVANYEGKLVEARARLVEAEKQEADYSQEYEVIKSVAAQDKAAYLDNKDAGKRLELRGKYVITDNSYQHAQRESARLANVVRNTAAEIERCESVISACAAVPLPAATLLRAALDVLEKSRDSAQAWIELQPLEVG